jgi:spore coat protein CotH
MLLKESGLLYCETSSVNLRVDSRHLGVFTMIENVDKSYINKHFGSTKGDLYKANYKTFLEWKGNDPGLYIEDKEGDSHQRGMLDPKFTESNDHGAVIEFIDFINNASDEEFRESIAERFGAEDFIKLAAFNTVVGNVDDYVCWGNNYFLYRKGKKEKWIFIPWDFSTSFCIETDFNIRDPLDNHRVRMWPNRRPLFERLFEMPEYKDAYYRFMREFIAESFRPEMLIPRIEQMWNEIKESARKDVSSLQEYPEFLESVKTEPPFKKLKKMIGVPDGLIIQSLPYFVRERHRFVDEELTSLGY